MRKFFVLIFLLFLSVTPSYAATRLQLQEVANPVSYKASAHVKVRVMQDETPQANPVMGEHIEFKIKESKEGFECKATTQTSSSEGYVEGDCTATSVGKIVVFAQSLDKSDSSNEVEISFEDISPPPSPTPDASQPANMMNAQQRQMMMQRQQQLLQQQQQSGTSGNPLGSGEGLSQEKERDDGLSENVAPTGPQVLGTQDSSKQDLDLLISLIFLACGLILIIGSAYAVITLMSRRSSPKKENKSTAIDTPPPQNAS